MKHLPNPLKSGYEPAALPTELWAPDASGGACAQHSMNSKDLDVKGELVLAPLCAGSG
jgi:hypothetical protein